ncbi:MAG: ATPase, T2SS/T4P/T4SS family [Candidatus Altiarchaeota archaeon]
MPELLDSYGNVKIMSGSEEQLPYYIVLEPELNEDEKNILAHDSSLIGNYKEVMDDLGRIHSTSEKEEFLKEYLKTRIKDRNVREENLSHIVSAIMDDLFLGYNRLGPLMRDEALEEIMVNGVETPVFVVHRRHGMCTTNITFETVQEINDIINWLSNYVGRKINEENPLLDAHMPDGSRANVAIPPAAPYGPAITIRKFKKTPYNMVDLIKIGSVSSELAAFLWVCVEGLGIAPKDILIAGGAGSGKTTLMNALAMFIPKTERIVTVEDTLELNFEFIENWVPLEASPTTMKQSDTLTMHNLLKNSLRMRPDRVIVGEVRGKEAETLFVAMDIGLEGSMGTLHANNARETTIRLMDEPMNVPLRMMPLLNLIVVMNRIFDRKRGMMRRVTQVSEISGIEADVVQLGDIYRYDLNADKIVRTEYPILLTEKIAAKCAVSKKRINNEILIRQKVLEHMVAKDITDNDKAVEMFQKYHVNPRSVISHIRDGYQNLPENDNSLDDAVKND